MPAMSKASRRSFLKALAGTTVAVSTATFAGSALAASAAPPTAVPGIVPGRTRLVPPSKIGIQMFTIRDKVNSLGFRAVFEELSRIGYSEVEFAGYTQGSVGAITLPQLRTLLDDFGLRAVGNHADRTQLLTNTNAVLDGAETLGMPYIGTGSSPAAQFTKASYDTFIPQWNTAGALARSRGMKIYQHNHQNEFSFASDAPEIRLYDYFLANTDPEAVFLEMDVYWAYVGQYRFPGFEPVQYILDNPTRFPLLHLKDGKSNAANANGYDIIEFGRGSIPYREFLSALPDRGARVGLMEQDNASASNNPGYPAGSLGSAEVSFENMIGLRG